MNDVEAHFAAIAATHPRCFWLDTADGSGGSLLGWLDDDDLSLTYDAERGEVTRHRAGRADVVRLGILEALETELRDSAEDDLWVGILGYACRDDLPASAGSGLPDAVWMRARHVVALDHPTGAPPTAEPTDPAPPTDPADPTDSADSADRVGYDGAFAEVQRRLRAGDSYEVNLTYRAEATSGLDPVTAYLRLRRLNPAPYAGFLQHDVPGARAWLLSSSPERFATIGPDRVLETRPIKGTTPRHPDPARDREEAERLRTDAKFRAENLMIVDLLRNDVASVSSPGTVEVPRLMEVESYRAVHQLVSTVRGTLRPELSTIAALRSLFPPGSMTGAPKLRTMEIIRRVEATPRGLYSGAFGWIAPDGRADLAVVIRSLVTAGDGRWIAGTGGGITVDSDAEEEYAESRWKIGRVLRALSGHESDPAVGRAGY
jgi:para-aminobenzoate synthetase